MLKKKKNYNGASFFGSIINSLLLEQSIRDQIIVGHDEKIDQNQSPSLAKFGTMYI